MRQQIDALTSTRGIAALLVVVVHYGCLVPPFVYSEHFFRNGNLAVGYFFTLSGFVMYWTYQDRPAGWLPFMRRRIARIGPLYWLAMLLCLLPPLYALVRWGQWPWMHFIRHVAYHTLFLQSFLPGNALMLNYPGWSLSVEMFFYALFPAMLAFALRRGKPFLAATALLYLLTQIAHLWLSHWQQAVHTDKSYQFVMYFPLFHLNQFAIGMAGGYLLAHGRHVGRLSRWSMPLLLLIVCVINYMPRGISMHDGLLAPLFMLLILAVATGHPWLMRQRFMVFLGEISYGIYILQYPVYDFMLTVNGRWLHLSGIAYFYMYVAALILFATICYYIVERPLRSLINR